MVPAPTVSGMVDVASSALQPAIWTEAGCDKDRLAEFADGDLTSWAALDEACEHHVEAASQGGTKPQGWKNWMAHEAAGLPTSRPGYQYVTDVVTKHITSACAAPRLREAVAALLDQVDQLRAGGVERLGP